MKRAVLALALALGCTSGPRPMPPPPACSPGAIAGLDARAVRWNGHGWGALLSDGHTLFLREYSSSGEPRAQAVALSSEAGSVDLADLAWSRGAWWAAFVDRGHIGVRLMRVARGEARVADRDSLVEGDLAVVPRDDASEPAAAFVETSEGLSLQRWLGGGDLGPAHPCPRGLRVRTITARGDGYAALRVAQGALLLVYLDERCRDIGDVPMTDDVDVARPMSLVVDREGAVAAWSDAAGHAHLAAVDAGSSHVRGTTLEGAVMPQRVVLQPGRDGARRRVRVVAIRARPEGRQLLVYQLDLALHLVDFGGVTNEAVESVRFVAADPWGGALVGWARDRSARGVRSITGDAYLFMSRVCP
ncbi:MAG: hypothetical protein R3A52_22370 [Polyangiales bacterium]